MLEHLAPGRGAAAGRPAKQGFECSTRTPPPDISEEGSYARECQPRRSAWLFYQENIAILGSPTTVEETKFIGSSPAGLFKA